MIATGSVTGTGCDTRTNCDAGTGCVNCRDFETGSGRDRGSDIDIEYRLACRGTTFEILKTELKH